MSTVDQANARLMRVAGEGSSDTYNGPQAEGQEAWHGNVGVFLEERRERVTSGDGQDVFIRRTVLASTDLPVTWAEGQVLTIRTRRKGEITLRVQAIEETEPEPGQPGEIFITAREE